MNDVAALVEPLKEEAVQVKRMGVDRHVFHTEHLRRADARVNRRDVSQRIFRAPASEAAKPARSISRPPNLVSLSNASDGELPDAGVGGAARRVRTRAAAP